MREMETQLDLTPQQIKPQMPEMSCIYFTFSLKNPHHNLQIIEATTRTIHYYPQTDNKQENTGHMLNPAGA